MDKQARYVTKYALTKGIVRTTLNERQTRPGGGFETVDWPGALIGVIRVTAKECFATLAEAQADAEQRRLKKIASLQRQIEKLKNKPLKVVDTF